ncbi:hypothetical protein RN001_014914 [Aquatica leii]|uniref:Uncharacterized protein n=1 Tax=Aquatica leii TaxID=1421715 RepID=A0AAN7PYY1_9COLE|nr:hypothetical protein RN001_014914 [Aquatica leii]
MTIIGEKMTTLETSLDITFDAEANTALLRYNLRNQKTIKYLKKWQNKKKKNKKKKGIHVVENQNGIVDNVIKNERVYISDNSFCCENTKFDLELQMHKLQINSTPTKNKHKKKFTKAIEKPENILENTNAIENFMTEFIVYLEELKKKKVEYKGMVMLKRSCDVSENGVKILSAEITEQDRLESSIVLGESQEYFQTLRDTFTYEM